MQPLCIAHAPCADGFTAAWVVKQTIPDLEYMPGVYGKTIPDDAVAGRNIIMVDFSVKRDQLERWNRLAASVLVLDHHKTAQSDLVGYMQAPPFVEWKKVAWQDVPMSPGSRVAVQFDMERSGAQIAWDYFNPKTERPALVDFVGDRDLWKFDIPGSRLVNAYVFANEYTFPNWNLLAGKLETPEGIMEVSSWGAAIEKKHHKDVAELIAESKRTMKLGGLDMPVANIPYTMASDAGHILASGSATKCAATYFDTPDGRKFSLRSLTDGPDVSIIAANYGGGGHRAAAGFQAKLGWEGDGA